MFVILVNKKTGFLSIVTKGSKKYIKMKLDCREYKENSSKRPLEIEVFETNKLLL
jgi:hypothetical protein